LAFLFFPSGTVIAFAGSTPPSGWLLCDGTAYNQADYPELFQTLSTTYNTQFNPTTNANWTAPSASQFRIPDYRASFLRGTGTPHPSLGGDVTTLGGWQTNKTAKNGLSSSIAANSVAASAIMRPSGSNASGGMKIVADDRWIDANFYNWGDVSIPSSSHGHTATLSGDNETRPHNRGVNYIIKI